MTDRPRRYVRCGICGSPEPVDRESFHPRFWCRKCGTARLLHEGRPLSESEYISEIRKEGKE